MAAEAKTGSQTAESNARAWLRLLFHSLTCEPKHCGQCATRQCDDAKLLWAAVLQGGSAAGGVVASTKALLLHFTGCTQGDDCPLCGPIHRELGAADPPTPPNTDTSTSVSSSRLAAVARAGLCPEGSVLAASTHQAGSYAAGTPQGDVAGVAAASSGEGLPASSTATPTGALRWLLSTLLSVGQPVTSPAMAVSRARGRQHWQHLLVCDHACASKPCQLSKRLLLHRVVCGASGCEVCGPCCSFFARAPQARAREQAEAVASELDYESDTVVDQLQDALRLMSLGSN